MAESWAGMIDATPDAVPVISPVDSLPGLHIATGFSGHGFGIGPGAGRLAADLVSGAPPVVDPLSLPLFAHDRRDAAGAATRGCRAGAYRPFHTGARFSAKARAPSFWSSLP